MANKHVPNSFQCPNAYVDQYMRYLTSDEFKVLTVIVRQTFGWQKRKAPISESLIAAFTGLSRNTAGKVCKQLCEFGIVILVSLNDPKTNRGNVYAPSLNPKNVDMPALSERKGKAAATSQKRITKARGMRASATTSGSGTTPPPGSQTTPPPGSGTSTENPMETQSKTKGADADAPPVVYEAKDEDNMTHTPPPKPIDPMTHAFDWMQVNDESIRRLRTHAKSETALSASIEFYRVSGIKVLPHGAKNRLAGGQQLYEACGGNLALIETAYNKLRESNAWVTDEWSLVKTVNVLASQKSEPANTGSSLVEWVTTPSGRILRYDGVPYPGDAGRQKCVELGISYEGN